MFRKSILQLRPKDKLFFLLVAIFAIGGIFFGVKAAIAYLSNSITGHRQELNVANTQIDTLTTEFNREINDTVETIKDNVNRIGKAVEHSCNAMTGLVNKCNGGLFAQLNALTLWQASGFLLLLYTAGVALPELVRKFLGSS